MHFVHMNCNSFGYEHVLLEVAEKFNTQVSQSTSYDSSRSIRASDSRSSFDICLVYRSS